MREKFSLQSHGALITGALIRLCSDYGRGQLGADKHL